MLYFAYGSNMFQKQMLERCPTSVFVCKDHVEGYSLVFNKKGLDKTGKANIILDDTGVVYGAVYRVNEFDTYQLDEYEGLGVHYLRSAIKLHSGCTCHVYIAVQGRCDMSLKPSKAYKKRLLLGLRALDAPYEYIKKIERLRIAHI